ncbi:MAG: hypothetical protein ABI318_20405 [Chthoniobacteraceae bacterium]
MTVPDYSRPGTNCQPAMSPAMPGADAMTGGAAAIPPTGKTGVRMSAACDGIVLIQVSEKVKHFAHRHGIFGEFP